MAAAPLPWCPPAAARTQHPSAPSPRPARSSLEPQPVFYSLARQKLLTANSQRSPPALRFSFPELQQKKNVSLSTQSPRSIRQRRCSRSCSAHSQRHTRPRAAAAEQRPHLLRPRSCGHTGSLTNHPTWMCANLSAPYDLTHARTGTKCPVPAVNSGCDPSGGVKPGMKEPHAAPAGPRKSIRGKYVHTPPAPDVPAGREQRAAPAPGAHSTTAFTDTEGSQN